MDDAETFYDLQEYFDQIKNKKNAKGRNQK